MSSEQAKQEIQKLVAKFESLGSAAHKLNEANTKKDYIEPLFACLGWDVYDSVEVSAEERASGGRVDYAFKLNGVSKFYVEAKPPSVDLNRPEYAKQAITYTYNKGVTWAVLTDFEEIKVFNGQTGRSFLSLSCRDYIEHFDDLWLLSRESFENNTLNERAEKYGALPQRLGIEERLYTQLRQWREELFTQIHLYNKHLTLYQVDEVIQRFFNRLIFIRTCEDRGIEEKVLLSAVHEWHKNKCKEELIEVLQKIFREFDGYYDSDLFSLHLVDQVFIESAIVEKVINGLYEISQGMASYDFSIIDADVLGAVYEQYLGHVAIQAEKRVKEAQTRMDLGFQVEEVFELTAKKQKRKEHGIYYTPKFIVDYIVKETLGHILKERSDHEIRNLKVLDMACGSGSFLIRAYDELLHYDASQRGKNVVELDQWERLPILTGNIFGVDLDVQAVEIARLNLLIRSLARREILPSLNKNICRGNSLISGKPEELKQYFGEAWEEKNSFNWETEFNDVIKHGGFDVIVGNPPYVRIQSLPREDADYYRAKYESAYGSFDIYILFIEKALELLKPSGMLGFITSGKFLKSEYGKKLQQLIYKRCTIENILDLSNLQVFGGATTYPIVLILKKGVNKGQPINYLFVPESLPNLDKTLHLDLNSLPLIKTGQEAIVKGFWPPAVGENNDLLEKVSKNTKPLGEIADRIFQGLVTSADKVYILEKRGEAKGKLSRFYSRSLSHEYELETDLLKPLLMGKSIGRYGSLSNDYYIIFPYKVKGDVAKLLPANEFASKYKYCWEYLVQNRTTLEDRENGKMRHENWYGYVYPKGLVLQGRVKIVTGVLSHKSRFTIDKEGVFYFMGGGNAGGYGITLPSGCELDNLYILGLLNSSLLDYCLRQMSSVFKGGFYSYARRYIERLPIRLIDFGKSEEKKMYDDLVGLASGMLELNKQLAPIQNTPCSERDEIMHEIELTDRKIDNLVYALYGLTEGEIRLVENNQQ